MGWYCGFETNRKRYIESLNRDRPGWRVFRQCFKGNPGNGTLWTVYERADGGGDRFLGCDLLRFAQGGWGHKPLDESCGPYETTCPPAYLALVPDPGGYATAFRERVRAAAAARVGRVEWGAVYDLPRCREPVGVSQRDPGRPRRVLAVVPDGRTLRVRRGLLGPACGRAHLTPTVRSLLPAPDGEAGALADALFDAGCEAARALTLLRGTDPTPRRFVLDALRRLAARPAAARPRSRKPEPAAAAA